MVGSNVVKIFLLWNFSFKGLSLYAPLLKGLV